MTLEHTIRLVGGKEDETAVVTCETRHRLRRVTICYRDSRIEESASDCFKLFARCRLGSKVKGGTCFATVRVWRSAHGWAEIWVWVWKPADWQLGRRPDPSTLLGFST